MERAGQTHTTPTVNSLVMICLVLYSRYQSVVLAGIATRNGILKISHCINLCKFEGESFGQAMIVRGSLEPLTPVLMTALVAAFALTPLLLAADAPGKKFLHSVAHEAPKARHGGVVAKASDLDFELVATPTGAVIYAADRWATVSPSFASTSGPDGACTSRTEVASVLSCWLADPSAHGKSDIRRAKALAALLDQERKRR